MVDSTRTVYFTEPAKRASTMALWEVRRLHHAYRGPEHYLLGLLRQGDSLAARVLVAYGLDLETVRAGVERLIAQGVLPGPPSDDELRRQDELQKRWLDAQNFSPEHRAEVERLIAQGVLPGPDLGDAPLLASLGIDLEAVAGRLQETFGHQAYWQATERVRTRPTQAAIHRPMGVPPPYVCVRFLVIARQEAVARDQEIGPEHMLLGLLRDAEDPVETESSIPERRLRGQVGLPDHGPTRSSCWSKPAASAWRPSARPCSANLTGTADAGRPPGVRIVAQGHIGMNVTKSIMRYGVQLPWL